MADCDVQVVSRRESRVRATLAQMNAAPRFVEVMAAQLDEQAAEMELRAAQARSNAIRCEARGEVDGVEMWCEVADTTAAHATLLRRQRAELIGRFDSCRRHLPDIEA